MLRETTVGDVVVLSGAGELSSSTAREIEARIVVLMRSHARRFVIDLSGCSRLTPAVVEALVKLELELGRVGGALVLAGARDQALELLGRSGYKERLRVLSSLNLALRFLESGFADRGESSPVLAPATLPATRKVVEKVPLVLSAREGRQKLEELLGLLPPPPFLEQQEAGEDW